MLFGDSCVACAGIGAALDANGVCQCADFATLVNDAADSNAVCKCDSNYLLFNDGCVMCSGVAAFVNEAGLCSCGTGAMLDVVDNLLQCVCSAEESFISTLAGDGCECDAGYLINEATIECVKCDTTSKVFEAFVNGVCKCKQGAILVDGSCQCGTQFIFDNASSSCIPCQKLTGAFVNK